MEFQKQGTNKTKSSNKENKDRTDTLPTTKWNHFGYPSSAIATTPIRAENIVRKEKQTFKRPTHPSHIIVPSEHRRQKAPSSSSLSSSSSSTANNERCYTFSAVSGDLTFQADDDNNNNNDKDDDVNFSFDRFLKGTTGMFTTYDDGDYDDDGDWKSVQSGMIIVLVVIFLISLHSSLFLNLSHLISYTFVYCTL